MSTSVHHAISKSIASGKKKRKCRFAEVIVKREK